MPKNKFTGDTGLLLPRRALLTLRNAGIFAHSPVSVHYQERARRYVLRGIESGGAQQDMGRYVSFAGEDGAPLEYLHLVETIARNGVHAVVVAPLLLRADMVCKGRTYELLITRHSLHTDAAGKRPKLGTEIVFRGVHGRVELDLTGKDKAQAGDVMPTFYSLAGEHLRIPQEFGALVRAVTRGANCIGCSHAHFLRKPDTTTGSNGFGGRHLNQEDAAPADLVGPIT